MEEIKDHDTSSNLKRNSSEIERSFLTTVTPASELVELTKLDFFFLRECTTLHDFFSLLFIWMCAMYIHLFSDIIIWY